MWECGDMDITFVIPKPFGDEEKHFANIIGMSQVPIVWRDVNYDYVRDRIGNVMNPDLYYRLRDHIYADFNYMRTKRPRVHRIFGTLPRQSCRGNQQLLDMCRSNRTHD